MTGWLGAAGQRFDLETVGSTNDEAMARARAGAPHGTVVTARAQTRGRGRLGRTWHSPAGDNIYMSIVLRLPIAPSAAPPLTLAAGVAVCDAVNGFGVRLSIDYSRDALGQASSLRSRASIKWPNDVLIGDKKVAGILTETSTRGDRLEAAVIGIGVNANTKVFPDELAAIATSIARERNEPVEKDALVDRLLDELERRVDMFVAAGTAPIVRAWKERTSILGRRLRVSIDGRIVEGLARDVDDEGALWLDADGKTYRVLSGEVLA